MQILLIAATATEIAPFTRANNNVDVLITGVGVPATLYHLQKRIHQVDYDFIIQAGIAGSFNTDLNLADVVMVKADCFGDLGLEEKEQFTPIFNSGIADKNEFPFLDGWLGNTTANLQHSELPTVKAVTVNKVSDSSLQKLQLQQIFNADIESMEGAALHYICLQEQIPFLQLRAVSNLVGERDKTKWNMKDAIENLNRELQVLVNRLNN